MKNLKNYDEAISIYMSKLGVSLDEARQIYAYDLSLSDGDVKGVIPSTNKEADLLTQKYQQMPRRYERIVKEDNPENKKSRPRKPDATKGNITDYVVTALTPIAAIETVAPEKTVDFTYNSKSYTFKLTKHNTYKGIRETKSTKRKVDTDKAAIINAVSDILKADSAITKLLIQTETALNFNIAETNYTLALTAHRKKK